MVPDDKCPARVKRFYFSLLPNYVYGYLEVTSIPDGQVYVDGQYAGDTPYKDFEKVGSHTVTVSKWGYHDSKQNVYINKDMVDLSQFPHSNRENRRREETDNIILFSIIGVLIAGIVIAGYSAHLIKSPRRGRFQVR